MTLRTELELEWPVGRARRYAGRMSVRRPRVDLTAMELALRLLVLVEVLGGVTWNLSTNSRKALEVRSRTSLVSSFMLCLRPCALMEGKRLGDDLMPRICFVRPTRLLMGFVSGEEESVLLCICRLSEV